MGKIKVRTFGYAQIHLKMWKSSFRVYFVLITSAILSFIYTKNFSAGLNPNDSYGVFEVCTFIISGYALYAAMLYVLPINDSPFEGDMSDMILLRMGRIRALIAEEGYLLLSGALFMLTWKLFAVLGMLDTAYFGTDWSESFLKLAHLSEPPEISPAAVFILDFINGTLYVWLLGNINLVGNTLFKKRLGHLLGVYAHGLFWAMKLDGIWGKGFHDEYFRPLLKLKQQPYQRNDKAGAVPSYRPCYVLGRFGRYKGVETHD